MTDYIPPYAFMTRPSYTPADPTLIAKYKERVEREVIPQIERQLRKKALGMERVRKVVLF